MNKEMERYKELSKSMLDALEKEDYDEFDSLLYKRQEIIDSFTENNDSDYFEVLYDKYDVKSIDMKMKQLLSEYIENTKIEIKEYKLKMQSNESYISVKKENLNIFSKRV
ncbi:MULTISPECIES: hypothetical protein [Clostridium]|uniref:hypothetical protein n=1 Tax=Clostridium TaxID=1485 RepID=UPI000412EE37|nr:hypothetical protein [Clostridium cadaveris]MDU4950818.1 hypothetical protein [Clostridium sp.]MDY4948532.1 hypothetical protein [Clostridium cadaveris]NME63732.1 hypothetical protein [Clostridium cadaveris]